MALISFRYAGEGLQIHEMQASVWSGISDSLVSRSLDHTVAMKPIDVALQTDMSVWNMRRGPLPSLQTPEMLVEQLEEALDKRDYHIECLKSMSRHLKQGPALKNGRLDLSSDRVTEFYRCVLPLQAKSLPELFMEQRRVPSDGCIVPTITELTVISFHLPGISPSAAR